MPRQNAVVAEGLGKTYRIYASPFDRIRHSLLRNDSICVEVQSLSDVSFSIGSGEVFGVIGRNGSGKSTLLKLLSGILKPTSGRVVCHGRVGALVELGAGFQHGYSGRANARVVATLMGMTLAEADSRMPEIEAFADVGDFFDRPLSTYSSGMLARLAFAVVAHLDPDVLLLDEILAVGDEAFQRKCFARLAELADRGCAMVFVSHSSQLVVELCHRAMLLDGGKCVCIGDPKQVVQEYHRIVNGPGLPHDTLAASDAMAQFDHSLRSESVMAYPEKGATIDSVRILDGERKQVNLLRRGESYRLAYRVRFHSEATDVEFGSLIKSVSGVELGGMLHRGDDCQFVARGSVLEVELPFRCALLPGTYFFNAGVRAERNGQLDYLHRILDALMFRVLEEVGISVSGMIDFSVGDTPVIRKSAA